MLRAVVIYLITLLTLNLISDKFNAVEGNLTFTEAGWENFWEELEILDFEWGGQTLDDAAQYFTQE